MKQTWRLLIGASALIASGLLAQVPQEWSAWQPVINAQEHTPGSNLNYRWRRMDAGNKNVPLEIEFRNPDYAAGAAKTSWNVMILYERTAPTIGYQPGGPARELCYLRCTAADSADGAKCEWFGSESAVGTKVIEARVLAPEKPAK